MSDWSRLDDMESRAPSLTGTTTSAQTASAEATAAGQSEADSMKEPDSAALGLPIQTGYEMILGGDNSVSIDYLLDRSCPWSEEAWEIVLQPYNVPLPVDDKTQFGPQEKAEIITKIGKVFGQCHLFEGASVPRIHFTDQRVHVTEATQEVMDSLWRNPPIFRERPMTIVSKGLPFPDISVFVIDSFPAHTRQEILKKLEETTSSTSHKVQFAIANMYHVRSMPCEPMCVGELIIFRGSVQRQALQVGYYVQQHYNTIDKVEGLGTGRLIPYPQI